MVCFCPRLISESCSVLYQQTIFSRPVFVKFHIQKYKETDKYKNIYIIFFSYNFVQSDTELSSSTYYHKYLTKNADISIKFENC